jgi:hypothetical protein
MTDFQNNYSIIKAKENELDKERAEKTFQKFEKFVIINYFI